MKSPSVCHFATAACVGLSLVFPAAANNDNTVLTIDQAASLLLRKNDPAFVLSDFSPVSSIRTVKATANGGYLVNAKAGVASGDNYSINPPLAQLAKDHIYGDFDGLSGTPIQVEDPSATINIGGTLYARVQYSNLIHYNPQSGNMVYGADIDLMPDAPNDDNRLSAIFIGDSPALVQGDALPSGNGFAGATSTGLSFIDAAGDTAFYRGSYMNGLDEVGGLFSTNGQVLMYNGMPLGPSGDTLFGTSNTSISPDGSHFISTPDVNQNLFEALVIDGQVVANPNGTFFREGEVVQTGQTEVFDPFNPFAKVAINNSGKWIAGTTLIDNGVRTEAMMIDGEIAFREGDVLPKIGGGNGAPLDGLPQGVDINNNDDVAFYFGSSTNAGALVLNGRVILEIGDPIGSDTITKFSISPISLSDRDENGVVNLFFDAADTGAALSNDFGLYHLAIKVILPGDLDGDGDVDGVDLAGFFSAFTGPNNGPASEPLADLDGDGDVDGVDLAGAFSAFTGPLSPVSVPEPASALLLTLGLLACPRRQRG